MASQIKINNKLFIRFFINKIFQYVILGILILFFLVFNEPLNHPSLKTLPTILLTCILLIIFNSNLNRIKILNIKFFEYWINSYSLYLWHYPIFSFYRINTKSVSTSEILILIIVTFISILSYIFFEKKISI